MKGFVTNIKIATRTNVDYRRVLYTGEHCQLVLMCLRPGEEIGMEVHTLDQFIRIEQGSATAILDGVEHAHVVDFAIVVPSGAQHNIINTGEGELKLYTLYAPPEHRDGTVVHTKAEQKEEHFDGNTTE